MEQTHDPSHGGLTVAVRIDLFSCESRTGFLALGTEALEELAAHGDAATEPRWLGFVAAADADEGELVTLLEQCAARGILSGAANHGNGAEAAAAAACRSVPATTPLSRTWLDVIGWSVETAAVQQRYLGWMTRYDRAGTRDDGAEEWSTSWSDAPTEGTGADAPWPQP